MKPARFDSVFARLFALVIGALLASHLITTALFLSFLEPRPPGERPPPSSMHETLPAPPFPGGPPPGERAPRPGDHAHRAPPGFWIALALQFASVGIAAWFGARMVARPIQCLAGAARALGANINAPPMREHGPAEAREAAQVFNRMQERIHSQMEERDRFLAAVSHDLRTPLTRMKLRLAQLPPDGPRERLEADIGEMAAMLDATLGYLRGEARSETWQRLDLQALVETITEDARDAGHEVSVEGRADPLLALPASLRRCLDNLVENAIRYGERAHIQLGDSGAAVWIEIRDEGPGIPENRMNHVLQPFVRLEESRNRDTGGVGLGLSIAAEAARRHGGSLSLRNAPGRGLIARVELPRQEHNRA